MVDYKKQGKRNRAMGADFERRVRKDLEEKGWNCSKYQNNVEFHIEHQGTANQIIPDEVVVGKSVPAKASRYRLSSTGFPDFIAYQIVKGRSECADTLVTNSESIQIDADASVFFVECKVNGTMSREEKEKARWYLDNNFCSKFLIAKKLKVKNKVVIEYNEFK